MEFSNFLGPIIAALILSGTIWALLARPANKFLDFLSEHIRSLTFSVESMKRSLQAIASDPAAYDSPAALWNTLYPGIEYVTIEYDRTKICTDKFLIEMIGESDGFKEHPGVVHGHTGVDTVKTFSLKRQETDKNAHVLMWIGSDPEKAEDWEFKHEGHLKDWAIKGNFPMGKTVTIMMPVEKCDETCRNTLMTKIRQAIIVSTVREKTQKMEVKKSRNTGKSRHAKFFDTPEGAKLRFVEYGFDYMSPTLLEKAYPAIPISLSGEDYVVPITSIYDDCLGYLKSKENVVISGFTGTGKTSLLQRIEADLSDAGYIVIRMDTTAIELLHSDHGLKALEAEIRAVGGEKYAGKPVILSFDEAQRFLDGRYDIEDFLELMDGTLKRILDVSLIFSINKTRQELESLANGAFMRKGRVKLHLDLLPMTETAAKELGGQIVKEQSVAQFDDKGFEALTQYTLANIFDLVTKEGDVVIDPEALKKFKK